jgi:hypothetical protein
MSLLAKKIRDLTPEERESLIKHVGTPDIPYPGIDESSMGPDGSGEIDLGMIVHGIPVISTRPHEQVVALSYSNMASPCALDAEREIWEQMSFDSRSFFTLVMGKPGWGKTRIAENISGMMDDRGFVFFNCADQDFEEIVWETVIDYSESYVLAIIEKIRAGTLLEGSLEILKEELPDQLTRDDQGKIVDFDRNSIKREKEKAKDGEALYESSREATGRILSVLKAVAENEGIPPQSENVIGMRKIPGPFKRAWDEGKIIILDEFTKGRPETVSKILELLNWSNGMGRSNIDVRNSIGIKGQDETASYNMDRSDRRAGFRVIATGNYTDPLLGDDSMAPVWSRIQTVELEEPGKKDWGHLASQILFNMPLTTLAAFFSEMAEEDEEEFAEIMTEWRDNKACAESSTVPLRHSVNIKNWKQSTEAVKNLAECFYFVQRLFDPGSELFDTEKPQTEKYRTRVQPEFQDKFTITKPVDPRIIDRISQHAAQARAIVKSINTETGDVPRFNKSAVGNKDAAPRMRDLYSAVSTYGTHLAKEIEKWVRQITIGMPETRKVIIEEFRNRRVAFPVPGQMSTLANLLNQDIFEMSGGTESVTSLRDILIAKMKKRKPALAKKTDDEIITVEEAAALCTELTRIYKTTSNDDPYKGDLVIPGENLKRAFNKASAVEHITDNNKNKPPQINELLGTGDFLKSLTVPAMAEINLRNIWRKPFSSHEAIETKTREERKIYLPSIQMAENCHESKLAITTVMTQNSKGEESPVHIIRDGEHNRQLIVTEEAGSRLKNELSNNFTVVTFNDEEDPNKNESVRKVTGFLVDALKQDNRLDSAKTLESSLLLAFLFRAGDHKNARDLPSMMARKKTPVHRPVYLVKEPE